MPKMAQAIQISAQQRGRAGKGAARATRREGRVPAVIYGNKLDSLLISLDPLDLRKQLTGPEFFAHVFEVDVDGEKHRVLARDLQLDPVTDRPLHVDFMRFSAKTRVAVEVLVHFENEEECPGIKVGGVLNVVRYTVELLCAPDNIPESLTVDLTGLEIGDSVHISSIELPEGVRPVVDDRDFTVATIAVPTLMPVIEEEEEEEGEEGVEGEVAEGEEGAEAPEGEEDGAESKSESGN